MTLKSEDLSQFIGSEVIYKHSLFSGRYTEGVQYVCHVGGAYWLLDSILGANAGNAKLRKEAFQVWTLQVDKEKKSAVLRAADGNGNVLHEQAIAFTDFPLDEIKFYRADGVLMLPSEY